MDISIKLPNHYIIYNYFKSQNSINDYNNKLIDFLMENKLINISQLPSYYIGYDNFNFFLDIYHTYNLNLPKYNNILFFLLKTSDPLNVLHFILDNYTLNQQEIENIKNNIIPKILNSYNKRTLKQNPFYMYDIMENYEYSFFFNK
jgi:hypothetical protein